MKIKYVKILILLSMRLRRRVVLPNFSVPFTVQIFLVASALLLCSSSSCLGNQYENCLSDTFTCDDVQFSYPFGNNGSGCGDPEFQLHSCDYEGYTLINIHGNQYHILESSLLVFSNGSINNILTIVNDNLWGGRCNLSGNYSQFWQSDSRFQVLDTYTNLTLWTDCNDQIPDTIHGLPVHKFRLCSLCGEDWRYSLNPHIDLEQTPFCNAFQVPVNKYLSDPHFINVQTLLEQGFEVSWHVEPKRDQICRTCLNSNGYCGYDISKPTTFLCYCRDGISHPDKCPDNGSQDTEGRNMSARVLTGCFVAGVGLTAIAVVLVLFFMYDTCKRSNPAPPLPGTGSVQISEGNGNEVADLPSSFNSFSALSISSEKSSYIDVKF